MAAFDPAMLARLGNLNIGQVGNRVSPGNLGNYTNLLNAYSGLMNNPGLSPPPMVATPYSAAPGPTRPRPQVPDYATILPASPGGGGVPNLAGILGAAGLGGSSPPVFSATLPSVQNPNYRPAPSAAPPSPPPKPYGPQLGPTPGTPVYGPGQGYDPSRPMVGPGGGLMNLPPGTVTDMLARQPNYPGMPVRPGQQIGWENPGDQQRVTTGMASPSLPGGQTVASLAASSPTMQSALGRITNPTVLAAMQRAGFVPPSLSPSGGNPATPTAAAGAQAAASAPPATQTTPQQTTPQMLAAQQAGGFPLSQYGYSPIAAMQNVASILQNPSRQGGMTPQQLAALNQQYSQQLASGYGR